MKPPYLHQFDFDLCAYMRNNVREACRRPHVLDDLRNELPGLLIKYLGLCGEVDATAEETLLLGVDELNELEEATSQFAAREKWESYPQLHQRKVKCVAEIKIALSPQDAQDWSRRSAEFSKKLEQHGLRLPTGCEVIGMWIRCIHQFLDAMGRQDLVPAPAGSFPTPLRPNSPAVTPKSQTNDEDLREMLRAIAKTKDGRKAKSDAVLANATINRQRGLAALRVLLDRGDYEGFSRRRRRGPSGNH